MPDNQISFQGKTFRLKEKISRNSNLYQNAENQVLHIRAHADSIVSKQLNPSIQDIEESLFADLDGVYKVKESNIYGSPFNNGSVGNYDIEVSNEIEEQIARQVILFRNFEMPDWAVYQSVAVDLHASDESSPTNVSPFRSGDLLFTLVDKNYGNSGYQQFNDIKTGDEIGMLSYNSNKDVNSEDFEDDNYPNSVTQVAEYIEDSDFRFREGKDLFLGLRAIEENKNGAYTELDYVDLFIQFAEPNIDKAQYRKVKLYFCFGGVPNLGSVKEELTVTLENTPDRSSIEYIVRNGEKTNGELSRSNLADNKVRLNGEINNSSDNTTISDGVVFQTSNNTEKNLEISSWEELPEESNYDDLICTSDPDPDPLPPPDVCKDENGNIIICPKEN